MINTILIFPIIACILMFLIKNKNIDFLMFNSYALLQFVISILLINKNVESTKYFALDGINTIFLIILSFVFLMVTIYSNSYIKNLEFEESRIRKYIMATMLFVLSMTGTILSADLAISWILVEATTLSSAYLIYFNKTKHSIEAAWKYVFICSIGIAMAFVGIILLNIASTSINTMNFNVLYQNAQFFDLNWLKFAFLFMMFGFGTKMGLAPVHYWLPDAHSEAPSPISALLSATLLNSAFLVIIKIYKIMEIAQCSEYAKIVLMVMGFVSLFVTAVFVYHIKNYKRMLAYSSIENMGIITIGLALGGQAYVALILHLIGHSLAKASFFLTSGNILELYNSKKTKSVKGLMIADSKTAWLWLVSFLGICAFPTSVLFISEFIIIKELLIRQHYLLAILFVLLLTIILFGMGRVVIKMAFGKLSEDKAKIVNENKPKISFGMYVPQIAMLCALFILGVYIPNWLKIIIDTFVKNLM
ncbi:hypothetical protein J6Q66_04160 [bacterium]|nr:hypothetical protein [bacterium]